MSHLLDWNVILPEKAHNKLKYYFFAKEPINLIAAC